MKMLVASRFLICFREPPYPTSYSSVAPVPPGITLNYANR